MNRTSRSLLTLSLVGACVAPAFPAHAQMPSATPFEFVGTEAQCGPGNAGSRIAAGEWIEGVGLPDDGEPNNNATLANRNDRRNGLLLAKTGTTPTCASSGATIGNFGTIVVDSATTLGFDLRPGSQCSGGAPRFNVDTDMGFFFIGSCGADPAPTAAPQDSSWTRYRFNLSTTGFPTPIPLGATIVSITVLFDEGTDTGDGLAVIDNIQVGNRLITNRNKSISAAP